MPFEVVSYSLDEFQKALRDVVPEERVLKEKRHVAYFDEYFHKIGVKAILIEKEYVDRDFIEDFSAYYVRCFAPYKRFCARFHFFTKDFTRAAVDRILMNQSGDASILRDNYAGFIVVKPLPKTFIGRTCLKNYDDQNAVRYFPVTQPYKVSLFSIRLEVLSLAFQEQDTEVAACATSALWSAFHCTGKVFQHSIPSPVEITQAASNSTRNYDRSMPAHQGLTASQMSDAIRSVGLEPHAVDVEGNKLFRATAYAYLKGSIPCVCIGSIVDSAKKDDKGKPLEIGRHAVTVTGFRFGSKQDILAGEGIRFLADRIDRVFVHDDQVGPFARLRFDMRSLDGMPISTSWPGEDGQVGAVHFQPETVLCPLYHKIRIPFATIVEDITTLDCVIRVGQNHSFIYGSDGILWDVHLSTTDRLKKERLDTASTQLDHTFLTRNLPKYLWVACGHIPPGDAAFILIFDATDLLQGAHFVDGIALDDEVCSQIGNFIKYSDVLPNEDNLASRTVMQWFIDNWAN